MINWNKRVFIVAEMGSNHCQSFQKAIALLYVAKESGADAVKVQLFEADFMADKNDKPIESGLWEGHTLHDLYLKTSLPLQWILKLKKIAEQAGLVFFTSVYYPEAVPLAEQFDNPIYKISSFEIDYTDLLEAVAKTNKTVILSTGSADLSEIYNAVKIIRKYHNNLAILRCVSEYPTPLEMMNLHTILDMRKRFQCPIGLSDHSSGMVAPVTAVALGARIIEKHLKVDDEGFDAEFSLNPEQFATMVKTIRATETALGKVDYGGVKRYRRKLINGRMLRNGQ